MLPAAARGLRRTVKSSFTVAAARGPIVPLGAFPLGRASARPDLHRAGKLSGLQFGHAGLEAISMVSGRVALGHEPSARLF